MKTKPDSRPSPPHFLKPDHLSLAVSTGDIEIVKMIVEAGGDPSKTDALGETPLHHAARLGLASVTEWLVSHGAPINAQNLDAQTPLEIADEFGQGETVRMLQTMGAALPDSWDHAKLTDTIRFLQFELVAQESRSLLLNHFSALENLYVPLDRAVFRAATLPFYQDTLLVAVEDEKRHGKRESFVLVHELKGDPFCTVLDWTNGPIYAWNSRYGINLSSDSNAISYFKFFFFFVRGQQGAFRCVEELDDIDWTRDATAEERALVQQHIFPVLVVNRTVDYVHLRGVMCFHNALFQSDALFAIHDCTLTLPLNEEDEPFNEAFTIGQGRLLNELLLEEELSVHVPGPPGRFG